MNPIWLLMIRCLLKNHEPLGWYDRKTAALLAEESQDRFLDQYCLDVNLTTNKI